MSLPLPAPDTRACTVNPMAMGAREFLRAATREAHQRVEDGFSTLDLAQREDFTRFLLAQRSALRALEPLVQNVLSTPWPTRLPLLEKDLALLEAGANRLPAPIVNLEPHGPGAMGAAYVLAGAHLGLRVLRQNWTTSTDAAVRAAKGFISDESVRSYWRELLASVDVRLDTAPLRREALEGAEEAFRVFERARVG